MEWMHSEIMKELDKLPENLYKYRSWDDIHHKKILTNNEIHFSKAEDLNDPFDLNVKISFSSLSLEYLIDLFNTKGGEGKLTKEDEIEAARLTSSGITKEALLLFEKDQINSIRSRVGIFSLSKKNKNIPMWSYYANSHKGFCVGFNARKLCDEIRSYFTQVEYAIDYPLIVPEKDFTTFNTLTAQLKVKSRKWKHEKEYRIIRNQFAGKQLKLNSDVYSEIIFGACIIPEHKAEIMEVIKQRHANVKVFEVILHPDKFKLQLEQIR